VVRNSPEECRFNSKGDGSLKSHITCNVLAIASSKFGVITGSVPGVNEICAILASRHVYWYRSADKSLVRPGRKQATATEDSELNTVIPRLTSDPANEFFG